MITLIHGDDVVGSRKALVEHRAKHEAYEKLLFDGTKTSLSDFVSAASSLSLFNKEKLIIIENLFSGTMTHEKEEILNFAKNGKSTADIIFWEQKELGKAVLKKYFAEAKVIFCQLPAILFKFLDSIGNKPASQIITMLSALTREREAEFILPMLIRQWRNLIIAADLGSYGFAEMPSWQAYKFINQARGFDLEKLLSSYRQLLSLDQKVKLGLTPYNLNQLLDIFLISVYYQN